jgi:hypothetical protein
MRYKNKQIIIDRIVFYVTALIDSVESIKKIKDKKKPLILFLPEFEVYIVNDSFVKKYTANKGMKGGD